MPRHNKTIKHIPYQPSNHEAGKTRYATEQQAQKAAEYQMLLKPDLQLYVYKSELNGGWYLTRSH